MLRNLHLWLGLLAGAVFVIVGLSGSLLAFRVEIDHWLNEALFAPTRYAQGGERASIDRLIEASKPAAPPGGTPYFVHFPRGDGGYCDVIYTSREADGRERVHQIVLDPIAATVIGSRLIVDSGDPLAEPFTVLLIHLHSALLQGEAGATFVGFVGLFLFVSLATGLYLWLPRNGKWRQAFGVKRGASAERLTLDLHKTTGVYAVVVLAVILFSGIYLIFNAQVRALVGWFSPVGAHRIAEGLASAPAEGRAPIGAEAAVAAVDRLFPDGRLLSLALPNGPDGVYVIGKRADDEVAEMEPNRQAAVDQYSGAIVQIQDPHAFTPGEKLLEWLYPLHTGEAFGDLGRAFICLMGVVPALLYATGLLRWAQKRRARQSEARN